jgi:hypothetical protein
LLLASWSTVLFITGWKLSQWVVPMTLAVLAGVRFEPWKEIIFEHVVE